MSKEAPGLCVTVNDASETKIINNDPPAAADKKPVKGSAEPKGAANVDTP